jgi:hypothetical protein
MRLGISVAKDAQTKEGIENPEQLTAGMQDQAVRPATDHTRKSAINTCLCHIHK